jgi:hypothetical protein
MFESGRNERVDDLTCGHKGTRVVRDIDVKSGVHLLSGVMVPVQWDSRLAIASRRSPGNGNVGNCSPNQLALFPFQGLLLSLW